MLSKGECKEKLSARVKQGEISASLPHPFFYTLARWKSLEPV